jgi:hypothetical protein
VVGSLRERNAIVAYRDGARIAAIATVGRDRASLEAELALARNDQPALEGLLRV